MFLETEERRLWGNDNMDILDIRPLSMSTTGSLKGSSFISKYRPHDQILHDRFMNMNNMISDWNSKTKHRTSHSTPPSPL